METGREMGAPFCFIYRPGGQSDLITGLVIPPLFQVIILSPQPQPHQESAAKDDVSHDLTYLSLLVLVMVIIPGLFWRPRVVQA